MSVWLQKKKSFFRIQTTETWMEFGFLKVIVSELNMSTEYA